MRSRTLGALTLVAASVSAWAQTPGPLGYSVATPGRSARRRAHHSQRRGYPTAKPLLGQRSIEEHCTRIELSLKASMERAFATTGTDRVKSGERDVRAERLRALSALLPQLAAQGRQGYESLGPARSSSAATERRQVLSKPRHR